MWKSIEVRRFVEVSQWGRGSLETCKQSMRLAHATAKAPDEYEKHMSVDSPTHWKCMAAERLARSRSTVMSQNHRRSHVNDVVGDFKPMMDWLRKRSIELHMSVSSQQAIFRYHNWTDGVSDRKFSSFAETAGISLRRIVVIVANDISLARNMMHRCRRTESSCDRAPSRIELAPFQIGMK